jgi:3-deoxy-manno-octulosonate cytidylyltransferase (CMP-KDO synthetase)
MNAIAIIPARMDSSRFPGKPMAKICDIPMVGHCYLRTSMCGDLSGTYVATCDQEISNYIESIGGSAIMTSRVHERASDRAAEAMQKIEERTGEKADVIVMVQGDEPMVTPEMISLALEPFKDDQVNIVNLMAPISTVNEFNDPNEVKVVVDKQNKAMYFSREPIPSKKKGVADGPMLKQVCVIPFRRNYLIKFNEMEETILERVESVDMLRIMENGDSVQMVMTDEETYSVDTKEELDAVAGKMKGDKLLTMYPSEN